MPLPRPDFPITYGIPIPPKSKWKYPFHAMEPGGSIWITEKLDSAESAAVQYGAKRGWTFVNRRLVENGSYGMRIWRTV